MFLQHAVCLHASVLVGRTDHCKAKFLRHSVQLPAAGPATMCYSVSKIDFWPSPGDHQSSSLQNSRCTADVKVYAQLLAAKKQLDTLTDQHCTVNVIILCIKFCFCFYLRESDKELP